MAPLTTAAPPPGARPDWTIPQDWAAYTPAEHALWDKLFARQAGMLRGRASEAFLRGVEVLRLARPGVPNLEELSEILTARTGWSVAAVPGLVPDEVFFRHLSERRFVAGRFLRRPDQIDYIQEPDVFHDVFGHVPMLADPVFADYMQAYGAGGLRSLRFDALDHLARLYWYSVEFGLVREAGALRVFGAGIVSSFSETHFALESPSPNRVGFELERVMRTLYRIDDFQETYFVIDSFQDLLKRTLETDFAPLYARLAELDDIAPGAVIEGDAIIQRGDHTYRGRHAPD